MGQCLTFEVGLLAWPVSRVSLYFFQVSKMVYNYLCIIGHVYNDQKTSELITEILNNFLDGEI